MNILPDHLFLRHPAHHDIYDVLSFLQKYERATFGDVHTSEAGLHSEWQKTGFDLSKDAWLVINQAQEIIGYTRVWHHQYSHIYTQVVVFPIHYIHDVKPFLLAQVEQRALEWAKMAPAESQSTIRTVISDNNDIDQQILLAAGYRQVKSRYRMQISLAAPLAQVRWPDGISVRSALLEQDIEDIFRLQEVAFAQPEGYPTLTLEEWKNSNIPQEGFDPTLWFVASQQDTIVGICLCSHERNDGIIGILAVHPFWRQKGLGQALLLYSFNKFLQRGIKHVRLSVDPDIASTAVRLYKRVGMSITDASYQYAKAVR